MFKRIKAPITLIMVVGEFTQETNLVVIGGGPGGYTAAFRAAELGIETIIVDASGGLGGVCLQNGCIPSKTMLSIGQTLQLAEQAAKFGIHFDKPRVDLDEVRKWTTQTIDKLGAGLNSIAKKHGIEIIKGTAGFEDQRQLSIHSGSSSRIRFKRAIIATGAIPVSTPDDWCKSQRVMEPSEALKFREIPKSLLVIGGGYIGVELATIYAALGSEVTLVTPNDRILQCADADLVRPLIKRLSEVFASVQVNTNVTSMKEVANGIEANLKGDGNENTAVFDYVIVAIGHQANTDGLDLAKANVKTDAQGYISVDEQLHTTNQRIYAIGDVTGSPLLADKAILQGRIAAEAIAGWGSVYEPQAVPFVVFTDPQIAWCGLTETQANEEGIAHESIKIPWGASGRAVSLGRSEGLTKLIYDPDTKLVLGVGIVGVGAAEMISQGVLAIEMGAVTTDLASAVYPHPTIGELLGEAALRA